MTYLDDLDAVTLDSVFVVGAMRVHSLGSIARVLTGFWMVFAAPSSVADLVANLWIRP